MKENQPNQSLFLAFILLFLVLALVGITGCQSPTPSPTIEIVPDEGEQNESGAAVIEQSAEVTPLQIIIPANDHQIGTPRIPFILMDGSKQIGTVEVTEVIGFDLSTNPPTEFWTGQASNYSDYLVPYWVIYPEIETAGNYGFRASILLEDGTTSQSNFAVAVAAEAAAPAVGDGAIPSDNRTTEDGITLAEISSDPNPEPAFYTDTIEVVAANDRPTVIAFNTPAYCQTAICAPVLSSIKAVWSSPPFDAEVDFIHIEIYKEFDPLIVDDTVTEWNLQSEPWTYVLDGTGEIAARMAGPVSETELAEVLEQVLKR